MRSAPGAAATTAPRPITLLGLVVLGGALGVAARAGLILPVPPEAVVLATFAVNVVGSMVLGVVIGWLGSGSPALRAFLGTGILGGFTTYSAFAVQIAGLADGRAPIALAVALASVFFGVVAALLGLMLGRRFAREPLARPEDAE